MAVFCMSVEVDDSFWCHSRKGIALRRIRLPSRVPFPEWHQFAASLISRLSPAPGRCRSAACSTSLVHAIYELASDIPIPWQLAPDTPTSLHPTLRHNSAPRCPGDLHLGSSSGPERRASQCQLIASSARPSRTVCTSRLSSPNLLAFMAWVSCLRHRASAATWPSILLAEASPLAGRIGASEGFPGVLEFFGRESLFSPRVQCVDAP